MSIGVANLMANIITTFSKQQDTQILCQTGYNQPIMVGIQSVGWLIQSMTFPTCRYSSANWEHEEFFVGQEVIINGDNIHWKYQQWRLIALITQIRYFTIPPESNISTGLRRWTSVSGWIIRAARHWVGLIMSFNNKGCSYIEQMASVVQYNELANDKSVYHLVVSTNR